MNPILATDAFRSAVALAVANGGTAPQATTIAFGTGTTLPSVEDVQLEAEFHRQPLTTATATGVMLQLTGTLDGGDAGSALVTEVGVFSAAGVLMGRRVFQPKQLEPETSIEFSLDFQF